MKSTSIDSHELVANVNYYLSFFAQFSISHFKSMALRTLDIDDRGALNNCGVDGLYLLPGLSLFTRTLTTFTTDCQNGSSLIGRVA